PPPKRWARRRPTCATRSRASSRPWRREPRRGFAAVGSAHAPRHAASCQTAPESIGLSPTSRVGHCPTPTCFPSKVALPEGRMWPNRQRNGSVTVGHVWRICSLIVRTDTSMPIKIPDNLPARSVLEAEGVMVMLEKDAVRQDIRPMRIGLLNLMPNKVKTETQFARLLGASPLQVELTLVKITNHTPRNTPT